MKFLIVGSLRHLGNDEQVRFKLACAELGAAMADQEHVLLLCSADDDVADPYVASGACSRTACEIVFYRANDETLLAHPSADVNLYQDSSIGTSGAKLSWFGCNGDWQTVFSEAIRACDAVLAIGGGVGGTQPVTDAAISSGKPVVLIPSFGGEAEAKWPSISAHYSDDERNVLTGAFSAGSWGVTIINAATSIAGRAESL